MAIRVATPADLPRILDLGQKMHAESSRWSRITFNRDRAAAALARIIESTHGVIFVAERGDEIQGGIVGVIDQHWASDAFLAHELALFVDQDARGGMAAARLVCALREWGRIKGAAWLQAGTSTGVDPERTAGLYEAMGFTRCLIGLEVNYVHGS